MTKRILKAALVCVALLALAAPASAATIEVNMYGASAQYIFWKNLADDFLIDTYGCAATQYADTGGKQGATKGTGCSNGNTYYIRYASKASYDGINAMLGTSGDGCGAGERKFCDETKAICGDPSNFQCKRVTLGCSDVSGEAFTQTSRGALKGPAGGSWTVRQFNGIDTSTLSAVYQPLVVPFGFFVNSGVQVDGATMTNISRMQAVMIFSDQAKKWRDFGNRFNAQDIVACLRHAGSGTHATLDYSVMRGGDWGFSLPTREVSNFGTPPTEPYATRPPGSAPNHRVWFNDGSSDMMSCINTQAGAIGYADADQATSVPPLGTKYANVKALKYQGVEPKNEYIANGWYDFWSVQFIYWDEDHPQYATLNSTVEDMMSYAAANGSNDYWVQANEMFYSKTSDFEYPGKGGF